MEEVVGHDGTVLGRDGTLDLSMRSPATETNGALEVHDRPTPEFLAGVNHEFARRHLIHSAGVQDGVEVLLVAETTRPTAVYNVGVHLGRPVRTQLAPAEAIAAAIDRDYARASEMNGSAEPSVEIEGSADVERDLDAAVRDAERDVLNTQGNGRVKAGRSVDLRVSTLPSTYGERVVLRLLDPERSSQLLTFAGLGMPPGLEKAYLSLASRTSGILLSTGPTGSGKTTTLYATLAWVSATNGGGSRGGCELNIMTVEDPVEYDLSSAGLSVSQTQVDPKKNVTFATGLRHILRQDPDVIMVGEIRDEETARIAVQSSLTGHLVLSTLHTNDAASAVARLIDLGIEPFLVASSLVGVLAQRLVRKVHVPCAGGGCAECLGTGFKGRTGVFELLVVDGGVRDLVLQRCSALDLKAAGRRAGMVTLRQAGTALVRSGVTTEAEVERVIEALEGDL